MVELYKKGGGGCLWGRMVLWNGGCLTHGGWWLHRAPPAGGTPSLLLWWQAFLTTQKVMSLCQLLAGQNGDRHELSHQMIRGELVHMRNVVPRNWIIMDACVIVGCLDIFLRDKGSKWVLRLFWRVPLPSEKRAQFEAWKTLIGETCRVI